jgi:hypothetical protein
VTGLSYEPERARPSETIAGFLSAIAIFAALIGIAWHPLRLVPFAMLISLIAAAMAGGRYQRLAFAAAMISAASFFLGMTIAVALSKPLW